MNYCKTPSPLLGIGWDDEEDFTQSLSSIAGLSPHRVGQPALSRWPMWGIVDIWPGHSVHDGWAEPRSSIKIPGFSMAYPGRTHNQGILKAEEYWLAVTTPQGNDPILSLRIQDLLPGSKGWVGVTAEDNRRFVEAVLYRYRAGVPWRDLPERFGHYRSIHTRFRHWAKTGVWE